MNPITIRDCRAADSDTVLEIFNRSVREIASRDYTAAQIAAWAPPDRDISAFAAGLAAKPTFIAEIAGHGAGFADLEADGHIDLFFVHPRFERLGVGRALLEHIVARAQRERLGRLHAEISITARPLFERGGFVLLTSQDVEVRGQVFRNFRMEKKL